MEQNTQDRTMQETISAILQKTTNVQRKLDELQMRIAQDLQALFASPQKAKAALQTMERNLRQSPGCEKYALLISEPLKATEDNKDDLGELGVSLDLSTCRQNQILITNSGGVLLF